MTRNLKILGAVLAGFAAFGTVAVAGASAQQGTLTASGPMTLTESENGVSPDYFEAFSGKLECPGTTYTAHKYNETAHKLIPSGSTTATVTPHYKQIDAGGKINCKTNGFPATIKTNGCDYVLHLGETNGEADTYRVTTDIICPANTSIEIMDFTTEAEDPTTPFCTIKIGTQAGKPGLTLKDTTNGTLDLKGIVTGLNVSRTNHGAHTLLCAAQAVNNGTLKTEDLVLGHNSMGVGTSISLSHP